MTVKKYYHVGIAVDTPHGLMVPKLRNADNKNISLISTELKKISQPVSYTHLTLPTKRIV